MKHAHRSFTKGAIAALCIPAAAGLALSSPALAVNAPAKPVAQADQSAQMVAADAGNRTSDRSLDPSGQRARSTPYGYRASELIGKEVKGAAGKDVGEIKDLVIDIDGQKVNYAVLEFDPGIASGEKYFAFPLSAFQFRRDREDRAALKPGELTLNMPESKLRTMPGFDKDRWPAKASALPGSASARAASR